MSVLSRFRHPGPTPRKPSPLAGALLRLALVALFWSAAPPSQAQERLRFEYALKLSGINGNVPGAVRERFDELSVLKNAETKSMVSVSNLRSRLREDVELLRKILRAQGFYAPVIDDLLSRRGKNFDVEIRVDPGPRYVFGSIDIQYDQPPARGVEEQIKAQLLLEPGAAARARDVLAAEARLRDALPDLGFPFAKLGDRKTIVDHAAKKMNLVFHIETGGRQRFGEIRFDGAPHVEQSYLRKFIIWDQDDYYDQRKVDEFRERLSKTGLFAGVSIDKKPAGDGHANLDVDMTEAQHRTINVSAGYSTAEGIGGEVSWEHRNIFNRGERLRLALRAAEIEQALAARLELPNFKRLDQTLSIEGSFKRQNTDAYDASTINAGIGLDRVITSHLALSAGGELEYSDITDVEGNREFLVAALPLGARWDSSNDLLNPTKGVRVNLTIAPSLGREEDIFFFTRSELRASVYQAVDSEHRYVAALRGRVGSIIGAANNSLPATRRFYAGGGGSIRGFSYQHVGPLDSEGDPIGGRSVLEVGAEFRARVSDSIGVVPFIEAGNVYTNSIPQFSDMRYAVGLGGRYYTDFGPVRLDIAVPLNKRPGEHSFQFYISLGQAF